MKTVGLLLKEARVTKNYSREEVSSETKIKQAFIEAIEKGDWEVLPERAIVIGFVKALAHFLEVDENQAIALLRRDYSIKLKGSFGVAQDDKRIKRRFVWGPRLTFLTGVMVIVLIVVGYLGFQYRKFNLPPSLAIYEPKEEQIVKGELVRVKGKTDSEATIEVNNQLVLVEKDGSFSAEVPVSKNTNEIKIIARTRSGKETSISRRIKTS